MHTNASGIASAVIRFGVFETNLKTGELRKRGIRVALQDQPLRVLSALLERPGEIVGREELCRRLWPHGTFVDFEHSLNAAVRRLRVTLGDEAEVPRFIETVHKRGYRFLLVNEVVPTHVARGQTRLAVLPFGPSDDVFTNGLTEEAITRLAQCCPPGIGVLARTSVERAHREGRGAAEIGRALGADYLVEGHVRREGQRLRITAQLIASQEETHLWANTFDCTMTDDTLTVQTEVAGEIASAVTGAISRDSASRDSGLRVPGSLL